MLGINWYQARCIHVYKHPIGFLARDPSALIRAGLTIRGPDTVAWLIVLSEPKLQLDFV